MRRICFHKIFLDAGSVKELRQRLLDLPINSQTQQVLTVNPEFVVLTRNHPELCALTERANLSLVDGIGLAWAIRHISPTERYAGADAVTDLCAYAAKNNLRIGILVPTTGLSSPDEIIAALKKYYPDLQCRAWSESKDVLRQIQHAQPHILFVTFGQPRQDIWIDQHRHELPGTRLAMGVGGAIDFLTGIRTRAPLWIRRANLEWLWRLITQPKRLPRILRATFGFWFTLFIL